MVYVDPLIGVRSTSAWPYTHACHLVADEGVELTAFAQKLGLKPAWRQRKRLDHFDLTPTMRRRAVKLGARSLTTREMGNWLRERHLPTVNAL